MANQIDNVIEAARNEARNAGRMTATQHRDAEESYNKKQKEINSVIGQFLEGTSETKIDTSGLDNADDVNKVNDEISAGNTAYTHIGDKSSAKDAENIETTYLNLGAGSANQSKLSNEFLSTILPPLTQLIPRWGYSDFIRERMNWQKGIDSFGGEPGWFYFKIFFHFNTSTGLFGGILGTSGDNSVHFPGHNCANKYLEAWKGHYIPESIAQRQKSLKYFVNCLNNISINAPWFFQSVTGLDKVGIENMNEPWKNNSIEIKCLEESIDMRLTKLMDYYKFAAFDYINYKEIIPENLRKFDMTIVLFGLPIRYLDTSSKIMGEKFSARQLNPENGKTNKMTFKLYSFKNCEFDMSSLNASTPSEVTVNEPFQMGKSSIKINYQKVFSGTQDGFGGEFVSDLGLIDYGTSQKTYRSDISSRLSKMAQAYKKMKNDASAVDTTSKIADTLGVGKYFNMYKNSGLNQAYKALIDETEMMCQDYYNNVGSKLMNYGLTHFLGSSEMGSITPPEYSFGSDYYKKQLKSLAKGKNISGSKNTNPTKNPKVVMKGTVFPSSEIDSPTKDPSTIIKGIDIPGGPNTNPTKNPDIVIHGTVFPHRGTSSPTKDPKTVIKGIKFRDTGTLGPTVQPITNDPTLSPTMPGGPNTNPTKNPKLVYDGTVFPDTEPYTNTVKPIQNLANDLTWGIHTPIDPSKKQLDAQEQAIKEAQRRAELRKQLFGDYDSKTGIGTEYYKNKLRQLHDGTIDQRTTDNLKKNFGDRWEN